MIGKLRDPPAVCYAGISAVRMAFVDFLSFNLVHMAKEEDIINNLLRRYYTDDEIRAIEHRVVTGQTPESIAGVSKWMLKGPSNREIIQWLRQVEANADESVFNGLFALAEKELPANRFRQALEGLSEGVMLA